MSLSQLYTVKDCLDELKIKFPHLTAREIMRYMDDCGLFTNFDRKWGDSYGKLQHIPHSNITKCIENRNGHGVHVRITEFGMASIIHSINEKEVTDIMDTNNKSVCNEIIHLTNVYTEFHHLDDQSVFGELSVWLSEGQKHVLKNIAKEMLKEVLNEKVSSL